jgi:hypothetical protein
MNDTQKHYDIVTFKVLCLHGSSYSLAEILMRLSQSFCPMLFSCLECDPHFYTTGARVAASEPVSLAKHACHNNSRIANTRIGAFIGTTTEYMPQCDDMLCTLRLVVCKDGHVWDARSSHPSAPYYHVKKDYPHFANDYNEYWLDGGRAQYSLEGYITQCLSSIVCFILS